MNALHKVKYVFVNAVIWLRKRTRYWNKNHRYYRRISRWKKYLQRIEFQDTIVLSQKRGEIEVMSQRFAITPQMIGMLRGNRLNVEMIRVIRTRLPSKGVFVDVGANEGLFSILISTEAKLVISFEPVSKTFKTLKQNLNLNSTRNVDAHQIAIGDTTGQVSITVGYDGGNHVVKNGLVKTEMVPLTTLDDELKRKPHIIKIDVEGYEWEVLQGATKTITKWHPDILIEIGRTSYERKTVDAIRNFLQQEGYSLHHSFPGNEYYIVEEQQ